MLYDVGQIVGGFVGGMVSDKMGVRSPVVVVMLLFSWYGQGKNTERGCSLLLLLC